MGKWLGPPHEEIPRCGAKTRSSGLCGHYAMKNGRYAGTTVVSLQVHEITPLNTGITRRKPSKNGSGPGSCWQRRTI